MAKAHAVFDEASLARQKRELQLEAHHEILKLSVRAIKDTERYLLDNEMHLLEKQQGKTLTSEL